MERPQLRQLLKDLRSGDHVLVYKLDRLSRSLRDLLLLLDEVSTRKATFESLTEKLDTASATGRMMIQMIGTFAEFERAMIQDRTRAGLAAARKRGRIGGRPRALSYEQAAEARRMIDEGRSYAEVARLFKVHHATIYRLPGLPLPKRRKPTAT